VELLLEQSKKFRPAAVVLLNKDGILAYESKFKKIGVDVLTGFDGLLEISAKDDVDILVNALVGAVGLLPTLHGIRKGRRVALANKETLVIGGEFVTEKAGQAGAEIIPIDSEHSALLQCLVGEDSNAIDSIILTASGGPFRTLENSEFKNITVEQALNHPNWDMGQKITIDSATLMNKGLEVIEARWLFDLEPDKIRVVVHPQSIIHSMVEFADGSVKSQLGIPDMRIPIQYALTYPERLPMELPRLDFHQIRELTFEPPDLGKFGCLKLSYEALEQGGAAPAILNAANEEAVKLFLDRRISFDLIPIIVEGALTHCENGSLHDVDVLLQYDQNTREYVRNNYQEIH
jgi:1-deoxy-D-xylulose-5-phosphate reductoisomerase